MKLRTPLVRGAFGLGFAVAVVGLNLSNADSSVEAVAAQMACESNAAASQVMIEDDAQQVGTKPLPARARAWRFNLPGGARLAR